MCNKLNLQLAIMTTGGAEIPKNMQGSGGMAVPQLTEMPTDMRLVRVCI